MPVGVVTLPSSTSSIAAQGGALPTAAPNPTPARAIPGANTVDISAGSVTPGIVTITGGGSSAYAAGALAQSAVGSGSLAGIATFTPTAAAQPQGIDAFIAQMSREADIEIARMQAEYAAEKAAIDAGLQAGGGGATAASNSAGMLGMGGQTANQAAAAAEAGANAGVSTAAASSTPAVSSSPVRDDGERIDSFELEVMRLVNQIRADAGLQQLSFSSVLANAALGHATHMASVGQMAHDGIGDGTAESRVRATGFDGAWGENVARGQRSAEQVVKEWMASPTHRANIMNANFNQIAVEKVVASDGTVYWAQNFGRG